MFADSTADVEETGAVKKDPADSKKKVMTGNGTKETVLDESARQVDGSPEKPRNTIEKTSPGGGAEKIEDNDTSKIEITPDDNVELEAVNMVVFYK